jgi:hypothetical protein
MSSQVDGLFVCCGMNSSGIASAGGAGRAISDWILNGEPSMDLWAVDIRRFYPNICRSPKYLRERITETLGLHYAMPWPRKEFESMRGLRKSALWTKLNERGAMWGAKYGWERPNYFVPESKKQSSVSQLTRTFGIPEWHQFVQQECDAVQHNVAVFDQSSFSKYLVQVRKPQVVRFIPPT